MPSPRPVLRALIFDFDGLILDTEGPEFSAWSELYRDHGQTIVLEDWARCIGTVGGFDPYQDLEDRMGRPLDRELIRARRRARSHELIQIEEVRPGIADYLAEARRRGMGLAVASSSPREWVAGHLERLGLADRFDCLRCADDVAVVKPDPALYRAAIDHLAVAVDEALALEDSPNGILAAKRAGLACVACPNRLTRELDVSRADLIVESLADLSLEALAARLGWSLPEPPSFTNI